MSAPILGIVAHPNRPEAAAVAGRLAEVVAALGAEVRVRSDDDTKPGVPENGGVEFAAGLTACVAVGGDGTVLRAAHLVGTAGVPIIGVNVGRFGFLTEVEPAHAELAIARVLSGDHVIEHVLTLELTLSDGTCVWALNDVVLEKVESQRLVRLQLEVNDEIFTVYTCDGLIISTPTGSTAYNFSVGGPVVSPNLPCLIVAAVSPHMLFSRALVLAPTDRLAVHVMEDRPIGVTADGLDEGIVPVGGRVALAIGSTRIPFIRFEPESFPRRLARKFGL